MMGTKIPRNWTYNGPAQLYIDSKISVSITVSMYFSILEKVEARITIIWEKVSVKELKKIHQSITPEPKQILAVPHDVTIIGYTLCPTVIGNKIKTTDFYPYTLLTYGLTPARKIPKIQSSKDFIRVIGYLNDEFSGIDQESGTAEEICLKSGYRLRCGKSSLQVKDHLSSAYQNINSFYDLSFIELSLSPEEQLAQRIHQIVEKASRQEALLVHLQHLIRSTCQFLSILSRRKIAPVFYQYFHLSRKGLLSGYFIPITGSCRIEKSSSAIVKRGMHFSRNIIAFLECCPMDRQLIKGIQHLAFTTYESTFELRLLTACSSIEFFYSYWLRDLDGFSDIENMSEDDKNKCTAVPKRNDGRISDRDIEKSKISCEKGKTPYISTFIRFFMKCMGIDHAQYSDQDFSFLKIRNNILHGTLTQDEGMIIEAEHRARELAHSILIKILEKTSCHTSEQSKSLYKQLPQSPKYNGLSYTYSGWTLVKDLSEELDNITPESRYWNYEHRNFYADKNIKKD